MNQHPNLGAVRTARQQLDAGERAYRVALGHAMDARKKLAMPAYTADDVAEAAGVSRARVYQILEEEKGRSNGAD